MMKKERRVKRMKLTVEKERTDFKKLMLINPNYFGNFPKPGFKAIKKIAGNTKYEKLTCVGFNPNLNVLEATVQINLSYGYGGTLCKPGTTEYIRFFIDYGDGWENSGLATFNVHDIPDTDDCADTPTKPLSYVVTVPIEPKRDFCGNPVLPKVRAILSWEVEPPENNPHWSMVWGNTLECHIQIKPRLWVLADVVKVIGIDLKQKVKLPQIFEEVEPCPIPQPDPPPLTLSDLVKLYVTPRGNKAKAAMSSVEPHRFGFKDIQEQMAAGSVNPLMISDTIAKWDALDLNWSAAVKALQTTSGNVSYEELNCLGLDYNKEWLVATFHLKKPSGYSGNLCSKGSKEYIAFWADWNDTCEWTYLDTVEVNVYDIANIPADGLHYTAILPVDLRNLRLPCNKPKIARIRAVLSWNAPPSITNPDDIPYWGNRLDSHIQIRPGKPWETKAQISIIGGIGIADINVASNGLTKPQAKFAETGAYADANPWGGSHMRECPFGGLITVHAPPNVGEKYCIEVREFGSPATPTKIITKVWVVDKNGNGSWHYADPATGLFDYLDVKQNVLNTLARWFTSGDGLWEIRLRIPKGGGVWESTPWYRIRLDNTEPDAEITIDGGACDKYAPGAVLTGKFVARDPYFGYFSLETLPKSMVPTKPKTPDKNGNSTGISQTALSGNTWELDTKNMKPCGYVVRVRVWDRTIRNSGMANHNYNVDDKGFCLLEEV